MNPVSSPFSPRTTALLVGGGVVTFLLGMLLAAFGGIVFGERSAGHDTYSYSLVGHRALVELLEDGGIPVIVARAASAGIRPRPGFPLLLVEPLATDGHPGEVEDLEDLLRRAHERERERERAREALPRLIAEARRDFADVVVVLPKWRVGEARLRPGWIANEQLAPVQDARDLLELLRRDAGPKVSQNQKGATVFRPRGLDASLEMVDGDGTRRLVWLAGSPQLLGPMSGLEPIVYGEAGILVGRVRGDVRDGDLWIVSDPDLLNNRGLGQAENAWIADGFLRHELGAEGVVIDETSHGWARPDSLLSRVFSFPLVLVVAHLALTMALLGWSLAMRFGKALPPPPPLPPGKTVLIDNTAAILQSAGDPGDALRRYLDLVKTRVARRFSLAEGTSTAARSDALARLERARGITPTHGQTLAALERRAATPGLAPREAVRLARSIDAWQRALVGDPR